MFCVDYIQLEKQLVEVGRLHHSVSAMTVGKPYSVLYNKKGKNLSSKNNSGAVALILLIWVAMHMQPAAATVNGRISVRKHAGKFKHPGVLVSQEQLDFMKIHCKNHREPMYSMFKKAQASLSGSLNYTALGPPPKGMIICGPYSNPNIGCSDDDHDSSAAYVQSLLWIITGNKQYAYNAIELLNTYACKLKGFADSNAPLQAAWSATKWTRAAEIIRHSHAGWAARDIRAYKRLLIEVYVPLLYKGSPANGNWELSMADALMGIAVFTDNRKLFDHAGNLWKARVPAYFYEYAVDGTAPVKPPRGHFFWYNQPIFSARVNGIGQETCRDFNHLQGGMASTINAAETAKHQGLDLYGLQADRLMAAMEFHANFALGAKIPKYICGGHLNMSQKATYEIGYTNFQNRIGKEMNKTLELILWHRKSLETFEDFHMVAYEALTHGGPHKSKHHHQETPPIFNNISHC